MTAAEFQIGERILEQGKLHDALRQAIEAGAARAIFP